MISLSHFRTVRSGSGKFGNKVSFKFYNDYNFLCPGANHIGLCLLV